MKQEDFKKVYPYSVTENMVRRALGKAACKMLDIMGRSTCIETHRVDIGNSFAWIDSYQTKEEAQKVLSSRVTIHKNYLRGVMRRERFFDAKGLPFDEAVQAWLVFHKEQQKEAKKAERENEKADKAFRTLQKCIAGKIDDKSANYGIDIYLRDVLCTGEHVEYIEGHFGKENNILCSERFDRNGYSRQCRFSMVRRSFDLYIKKGYRVRTVGGLITFYRGKFNRKGMAVEWIEQGRAIADITKHSGFLVRDEHIEAKSLREAIRINDEHRAMQLARLLNKRKRTERREEMKLNGSLRITFADSLNAGNCRPGTQDFKNKYERAIGHEVKSISIADLRKYGKQFGVEYYAERVIDYVLNH